MFIEEIKNSLGVNGFGDFRALFCGDNSVYLTGIVSIKSFSKTEIIVNRKKGQIKIIGENLEIKKYCTGDILICGNIISFIKE